MAKFNPTKLIQVMALLVAASSVACDSGPDKPHDGAKAKPTARVESQPTAADDKPIANEGEPQGDEPVELDPKVVSAAKVADSLEEAPADAEQILAEANLDEEQLDALMYEIAADPDLTAQYRVARGLN